MNGGDLSQIRQVVFAGGGNRCFWQAGFWSVVAPRTGLAPERAVAVSAGAALACAIFANRVEEALALTCQAMAANPRNRYWGNLLRREPVFPHAAIYRNILLEALNGEALARLHAGPELLVEIARIPDWMNPFGAVALGLGAYQLEKQLFHPVNPKWGQRLGFHAEFIPVRGCPDRQTLADLILASSCTPPFTPLARWQGRIALDGGLVDNVPVAPTVAGPGPTLVLLTRPYKVLPDVPGRLFAQPSSKVPVSAWDYTSPAGVEATFRQGQKDAENFLDNLAPAAARPLAGATSSGPG